MQREERKERCITVWIVAAESEDLRAYETAGVSSASQRLQLGGPLHMQGAELV